MSVPASGMTIVNPQLAENSAGFWGLSSASPAINAALPGYAQLPQFEGIPDIDADVLFDLMGQNRPQAIAEKDLGCNEYPHNNLIQPFITEENTGPDYNTSALNSVVENATMVDDLLQISPNPVANQIMISLHNNTPADARLDVFNMEGRLIRTLLEEAVSTGQQSFSRAMGNLPAGTYTLHASSRDRNSGIVRMQTLRFVKQ